MTSQHNNPYRAVDETAAFGQAPVAGRELHFFSDGEYLIVPVETTELPRRCPFCNEPGSDCPTTYLMRALDGPLQTILVVALSPVLHGLTSQMAPKMTIVAYPCRRHRSREILRVSALAVAIIAGVSLMVLSVVSTENGIASDYFGIPGALLLLVGYFFLFVGSRSLRLARIEQGRAYLLGTHPDFRAPFASKSDSFP